MRRWHRRAAEVAALAALFGIGLCVAFLLTRGAQGGVGGTTIVSTGITVIDGTTITEGPSEAADLSLDKVARPDPVAVGGEITYTLTVANAGPGTATDVEVTDVLPAGARLVSATPTQGTCAVLGAAVRIVCELGDLSGGATARVTIVVVAQAPGMLVNTASVDADETDPNGVNDHATAVTTVTGCTVSGTPGPDVLDGGPGDDRICALAGDDVVRARGGDDVVEGGPGGDRLDGGGGADRLTGGRGNDRLRGRAGDDVVLGGLGDDRLAGGAGRDTIGGGPGSDQMWSADGRIDVVLCGSGVDEVRADRVDLLGGCELVSRV